jgi:Cu/Ag efflux pump CusA
VEQLITVPLEADLLNGVEGIEVIRSESVPGLSSIVMVFSEGTNIYRARQLVEERLTQAHALPNVSKPPTMLQPLSSSNRLLMIGLDSDKVSPIEQSVIARWTVRPKLMGVPGVANVSIWGMRDQQLQVLVDPETLREQGVTLSQVIESAGNAQVVSPLTFLEASTPGTGGFIETPQQRLQVRHLIEKIADPEQLAQVPVADTGGRLRLGDVSTIVVDHQPLIGDAVVDGGPGLLLVVEKFPGADTRTVTADVESALEDLQEGLSGIRTDTSLFRPATYVEKAMDNLALVGGIGFLLMLLVIAAVRLQWQALAIALLVVPLSLVTAALLLQFFGQGFNAIALAGLTAALVVVVDEAVVLTDRVMHRIRANRNNGGPKPIDAVVRAAADDVHGPLAFATIIVLLAITPLLAVGGRPGAFFAPAVWAYVLAVVGSVLVAVTVTPALSVLLFNTWQPTRPRTGVSRSARTVYTVALQRFSRTLRVPLLAAGGIVLLAALTLPWLGSALVPAFQDRTILVQLDAAPGTSGPRMTEIATELGEELRGIPGVGSVSAHVGRAITGDRVTDVHSSDVWVRISEDADYAATLDAIKDTAAGVPDVRHDVVPYTTQNLRDVGALRQGDNTVQGQDLDLLTGSNRELVVRIFGQDPQILREQAARVRDVMAGIDGVTRPRVDLPPTQASIEIEVDLDRAQQFGLTPGAVRRAEATLLQGIQVGSVFEEQKVFDVIVRGAPDIRDSIEDVSNLLIDRPGGGQVRLGEVADVRVAQLPSVIQRDAVSRRLDVTAGVSGRDVGDVRADVEQALQALSFPLEYHAEVLDESTGREVGGLRVAGFALAALVAIFLLLQATFRSWRLAVLVFASLPVALAGGLVGAMADGGDLSFGALLGFLVVLGLSVRAAVLLVSTTQRLERDWGRSARTALVQRAVNERLAAVVTTTACLAVLLAPVVVLGARPGLELLHPMALVVLGGMVTSTFVTLFLLPALVGHLAPAPVEPEGETPVDRTIDLEPVEGTTSADADGVPVQQRPTSVGAGDGAVHR